MEKVMIISENKHIARLSQTSDLPVAHILLQSLVGQS